ncbi:hypothetical protein [Bradyrhizobium quebecense]|uniref:Uncharacterized protein n=2 Tax=Bradyrhizobium quebecense TaxID=2748629 RepID=A0A939LM80_9BRAD|nr:hypothetical protein [Bradyrhizobium quebecense]UGA46740.1 hypothetical protein HU230_0012130 [Bradyrhizobium quebecense]UGY03212.1 hypothetical protein J4P68_0000070 [Bradyrhizobium quebecense]
MTGVTLDGAWAVAGYLPPGGSAQAAAGGAETAALEEPAAASRPKVIVRHDGNGVITAVTLQVEMGMETLSEKYAEMGIPHILYDGEVDIANAWVKNGEVVPKLDVEISGELRTVKADGEDLLQLTVSPAEFDATVALDGVMVHFEHVTDGMLSFAVDHPGIYAIFIAPAHPYRLKRLDVEAVAP